MNLPLYLITENDGIPIPNTTFLLDIPLHEISGFRTNKQKRVALGISTEEDTNTLLLNLKRLAVHTHKLGVMCTVLDEVTTDDFKIITLYVEHRIYIEHIEATTSARTQRRIVNVRCDEVNEDFFPDEEEIIEDINKLSSLITTNTPLFSTKLIASINEDGPAVTNMNIIANLTLRKSSARIEYLQSENNIKRFGLIIARVKKIISGGKPAEVNSSLEVKPKKMRMPRNAESIKTRFKQLNLDQGTRTHIQREINKLDSLQKASNEYSMVLDYMSWILDIPWDKFSYKNYDLDTLVNGLDKTHHGLDVVKEHILEHMTIEKIKGGSTGTVLCFVGPPGTGKTSIAKEIARVSGRHLTRIALGGLGDEAEIRGHRRTYTSSRPGRFIVGLKQAESLDPVFLLDEIDKLSSGGRGDPASALLEILDREQNNEFIDRYLEVPVDLSRAMFICTANYKEQIPEALRDRMEFIEFPTYSKADRLIIATDHLIPKAFKDLSLADYPIVFKAEAIDKLASSKQIRHIEKQIRKLLRTAAVKIVVNGQSKITIDAQYISNIPKQEIEIRTVGFKL